MALEAVGKVVPGVDHKVARQTDNPLIRPATGRRWQFRNRLCRNVDADNGNVAVGEFPNVGTPGAAGRFSFVGMGIGADSATENNVIHKLNFIASCHSTHLLISNIFDVCKNKNLFCSVA
jgi:hypothetical protein